MAKHRLLELETIPRDRKLLEGKINEARYRARRSRLINWAAIICVSVGVLLILMRYWPTSHAAPVSHKPVSIVESMHLKSGYALVLPIVYN